jgi:nicotinate-nucleotide adenylyltransferase
MRLGVFGGTFDPVHLGHLILAEQCREQARLDQVLFIPAARPPHKHEEALTPFAQRVEMLALAIAGQPAFRIDELEKNLPGPSYTARTLGELRRRQPNAELRLLLGADCLPDLVHWYEPARIIELAILTVAARPGWEIWSAEQLRAALQLPDATPLRLEVVHVPLHEISSRDLRQRSRQGRSLRYLVPRAVEEYIAAHKLYQECGEPPSS